KPILKNQVAPEVEAAVVELAIAEPAWGQVRVANEPAKRGTTVSAAGRALHLAAARSDDDEAAPEGAGGEGRPGRPHLDGSAGRGVREGEGRQESARRVREQVPGLLRGAGHLLRRHAEAGWARLRADVHRIPMPRSASPSFTIARPR